MEKTERVTLTGDFNHHPGHAAERTFRAGVHTLPVSIVAAARAKGLVEEPEVVPAPAAVAPAAPKPARVRKPKAKKPPVFVAAPAAAKPFPAKTAAKKPAAKTTKA